MDSYTNIARDVALQIARQYGCDLESLRLDGVEIHRAENGEDYAVVQATATITPSSDEVPFEKAA